MTAKLTGAQRKDLRAVLQDAFPTYEDLDLFLDGFDHRLSGIIGSTAGMDEVALRVTRKAESKRWLPELLENLLVEIPNDARVLAITRHLGLAATATAPAAYKLSDLTHYDLTEIEAHFRDVRIERETAKLVLAAVDCQDRMFLDCLQRRVEQIVRVTARPWIQVDGAGWPVPRALKELASYRETLKAMAVFCPVTVHSTAADLEALADGVSTAFGSPANELVVLLFIRSGWKVPPAVAALPSPGARAADVDKWVDSVGDEQGWAPPARAQVRNRILAAVKASDMPVYEVYKQLQGEIERLWPAKPPAA